MSGQIFDQVFSRRNILQEDLLVFDLRNGRVGGLSFCQNVESWFPPEQSFMIVNETDVAILEWRQLPKDQRENMRFIWGHNFTKFNQAIMLNRNIKFIQLLRHPLLKVSGMSLQRSNDLHLLYTRSVQLEFEEYVNQPGLLPTTNIESFLSGHYMLGITELMEESLFLLHANMKIKTPLRPWIRSGVEANINKNLFSLGLVDTFTKEIYYKDELRLYFAVRDRLLHECQSAGFLKNPIFSLYKKEVGNADIITKKWRMLFPQLFCFNVCKVSNSERRKLFWGLAGSLPARLLKGSPSAITTSRPGRWRLRIGDGPTERKIEDASGNRRAFEIGEPGLIFKVKGGGSSAAPNILHLEIDLPALTSGARTVRCEVMDALFFETDVGREAGVRAFDVPISTETRRIKLQIEASSEPGETKTATGLLTRVAVFHVPI